MNSISAFIKDIIQERKNIVLKYTTPLEPMPGGMLSCDRWEEYSPLIDKDIILYGLLEYRNWIRLEADKEVVGFCPQAVWMTGTYEGVAGKSLIDFYVLKVFNKAVFQEIKKLKDYKMIDDIPELKRQITLQKQWCLKNNEDYEVRTEAEIEDKPFLIENWGTIIHKVTLTKYVDFISEMTTVITTLLLDGEGTIREVTSELGAASEFVLSHLLHLKLVELISDNERMKWSSKVRLTSKWQ